MTFQFGPTNPPNPGAPTPPATPASQALSQAAAPPPSNIAGAIASAMQGIHDAGMRHPELPPDLQFDLEILDIRSDVYRLIGLAFFIDVKVNQCTDNATTGPGAVHCVKIAGFSNPDSKAFAFRDMKSFCFAALRRVELQPGVIGIPEGWNGTDQEWAALINSMYTNRQAIGQRVYAQTAMSEPGKQSGKRKLKVQWLPVK